MNPLDLIKEWETSVNDVDIDFMVSLWTAVFGRYDNESPPLIMYLLKNNHNYKLKKVFKEKFKIYLINY